MTRNIEARSILLIGLLATAVLVGGCGSTSGPRKSAQADKPSRPGSQGRGGYYLDDGPGDNAPANLDDIPDAVPRLEQINRATSRPYHVMGRNYTPMTDLAPYRERGVATWYGRRYHGKPTSSGEPYDMYRMTAAHPILPIPSYARVTNVDNGRSVVVRINDRGPFLGERLIDLSYVAAHKLDLLRSGSAMVEVESVLASSTSAAARVTGNAQTVPVVAAPLAIETRAPTGTPQEAAVVSNSSGLYLQLAAFAVKENAERFLERVRPLIDSEQAPLVLVPAGAVYRIQSGPYADRQSAEQAALKFETLLGSTPVFSQPR